MNKIEAAAQYLSDVDVLTLTDTQIMRAANAVNISTPGRWHLTRIRNAHMYAYAMSIC